MELFNGFQLPENRIARAARKTWLAVTLGKVGLGIIPTYECTLLNSLALQLALRLF